MKQLFLVLVTLMSVLCQAQKKVNFQLNEIRYAIYGTEVTVVGQTGIGRKIAEVTIPATVTYNSQTYTVSNIGEYAFGGNKNLVKLTMGDGVKSIGKSAFEDCRNLKRVTLSKTLEKIDDNAFCGCVNLDSLVLPASMKQLGVGSFGHCSRLKDIFCLSPTSPEFTGYTGFTSYGYLHVIKGCKKAYEDYLYWQYLYEVIDDIDPESIESEIINKKDDEETINNDDPDKNDDLNKGDNPNNDGGSTLENTGTAGSSNSTYNPDPDKDEEKESSTAIREISTMQSQNVFSLTGVRRDSPLKGVNIINGKKILVR